MHHPAPPRVGVEDHPHPGEIDLTLHTGFTVDYRHRGAPAPIFGALHAVPVHGALRRHHPVPRQQVNDLDHRQTLTNPLLDPIMVVAQHFPRQTVPIGAIRTHRLDHHTDQLIGELISAAVAIQPGLHRRIGIAAGGLAVHPSQSSHAAQASSQHPHP